MSGRSVLKISSIFYCSPLQVYIGRNSYLTHPGGGGGLTLEGWEAWVINIIR